jgi:hypothetical protein
MEKVYKHVVGKSQGRRPLGMPSVDEKTILKQVLEIYDVEV